MARIRARRRPIGSAQWAALGLLLVLLGGLTLTTLTHDWIGSLPQHDHLLVGVRDLGVQHHAHRGDPLDQALTALQPPAPILTHEEAFASTERAAIPDEQFGVVSLQPLSGLQPELNSYTATGLLALVALIRLAARGRPLLRDGDLPPAGRSLAPPLPPPRPA